MLILSDCRVDDELEQQAECIDQRIDHTALCLPDCVDIQRRPVRR
jgi:hypothetical protein